ncbi:hypothetical protein NEF87_002769 [Candidatus Lokiarchaeum ossiferum]|uniref:Uncharacterized protein n=1 Tax=Candidatus Lokiarchaeum ossiferum TaxID=2951803 RepID=A0ABY6HVK2_9ARCH|nr:hypothetical protein NEF87_002769 [Candidatus Lokiarchaeum sp. B-35]
MTSWDRDGDGIPDSFDNDVDHDDGDLFDFWEHGPDEDSDDSSSPGIKSTYTSICVIIIVIFIFFMIVNNNTF